jgi:hypothetical protein
MIGRTSITTMLPIALVCAALAACSEDDAEALSATFAAQRLDASTTSILDAGPALDAGSGCPLGQVLCGRCMAAFVPSGAEIQLRIFSRSCALSSACHAGNAAQAGLSLASIEEVLRTAVGQRSKQQPARMLIAPGDPAASYLIDKLRGHQAAPTSRMPPPPSEPLCAAKIEALEAWIAAGARNEVSP